MQHGRSVSATDSGPHINVVIDFLVPREMNIIKNGPVLVLECASQKGDCGDLAMLFYESVP